MLYYYHTIFLIAPLPYRDHDTKFILVLQAFEHLTKQFPPFGYLSLRSNLFENWLNQPFCSQDVFAVLLRRPYEFWILSGETPKSFQRLVSETLRLNRRSRFTGGNMSAENRVLTTLMWMRYYPTYALNISLRFAVSVSTVDRILKPSIPVWRQKRGHWSEIANVVDAFDGTWDTNFIQWTPTTILQ